MDEEATRKALPWEARGKLPIDPSQALLRHLVAGEIYHDQDPKNEIILMAAAREMVNQFLEAAGRAKLNVIGMSVEPLAIVHCFAHIYRRKSDADVVNCFVDLAASATRAIIARGSHVMFARVIGVGGEHFNRATAEAMKISQEDARLLRMRMSHLQPSASEREEKHDVGGVGLGEVAESGRAAWKPADGAVAVAEVEAPAVNVAVSGAGDAVSEQRQLREVEQACRGPLNKLVEELDLCRRYYEATFPNKPVERLIFIGGEARHRGICQYLAQQLGLAAQVGDPMVRMGRVSDVGIESGIDRRQPQPGWTVPIGLSLGPVGGGG